MSYQEEMNKIIEKGYVAIISILDPNGKIYFTNQPEWDGPSQITDVSAHPAVTTNRTGIICLVRAPNNYYFLTWSPHDTFSSSVILGRVRKMASQFK